MVKTVRFFKLNDTQNQGWFADVPNHTLEENQMVAGADVFLDNLLAITGGQDEVSITVSDKNEPGSFIVKLVMRSHNQWGATYVLTGPVAEQYNAAGFELWICNVTHDVLGEHPKSIYIHEIR